MSTANDRKVECDWLKLPSAKHMQRRSPYDDNIFIGLENTPKFVMEQIAHEGKKWIQNEVKMYKKWWKFDHKEFIVCMYTTVSITTS